MHQRKRLHGFSVESGARAVNIYHSFYQMLNKHLEIVRTEQIALPSSSAFPPHAVRPFPRPLRRVHLLSHR